MDIKNKTVLILGGWGLVGSAAARRIVKENPKKIVLTSLFKNEAEDICRELTKEFNKEEGYFTPYWGNIFVRKEFKDMPRSEYLENQENRRKHIHDITDELDDNLLKESAVYNMIKQFKPDIVIDCINTATAIAYQNIYKSYQDILNITEKGAEKDFNRLEDAVEKLICTSYVPQLIRHVQIMYNSMREFKTEFYLKVGTSGTGGMGLNIPYTHSEERPSRVLLSKSSIAGAQTLLLFLMARTPDGPIVKELKPTASIAWKKISYGEVKKSGKPIDVYDISTDNTIELNGIFKRNDGRNYDKKDTLKTVFIDTGENGIFSRGEFETITSTGQMEFVTPEEIAEDAVREIKGQNTGHDIITALDSSVMEPSYRAGFLQHQAVNRIKQLEEENNTSSVAFEMLGPPRLSKLLYEAHLIRLIYKDFKSYIEDSNENRAERISKLIQENDKLRNEIVSIGLPIMLSDGRSILRGPDVKIPAQAEGDEIEITPEKIDKWAYEGWLDLRKENWEKWSERFRDILNQSAEMTEDIFSSRYIFNNSYWNGFKEINIGKVAGWIFIHEDEGLRMKG